jgi:hypothetical protein
MTVQKAAVEIPLGATKHAAELLVALLRSFGRASGSRVEGRADAASAAWTIRIIMSWIGRKSDPMLEQRLAAVCAFVRNCILDNDGAYVAKMAPMIDAVARSMFHGAPPVVLTSEPAPPPPPPNVIDFARARRARSEGGFDAPPL